MKFHERVTHVGVRKVVTKEGHFETLPMDTEGRRAEIRQMTLQQEQEPYQAIKRIMDQCQDYLGSVGLPARFDAYVCDGLGNWELVHADRAARNEQRVTFRERHPTDARASAMELQARECRHPGLLYPADALEYAATVLLARCEHGVRLLENGSPRVHEIMRIGIEIGLRGAELGFVLKWERQALIGDRFKRNSDDSREQRKSSYEQRDESLWQKYQKLLQEDPRLGRSVRKAANQLALRWPDFGLSGDRIRHILSEFEKSWVKSPE